MYKVFIIESVYPHSMCRTVKLCSIKISNHVAHLLLFTGQNSRTTFKAITSSAGTLPDTYLFGILNLLLVLTYL